VQSVPFKMAIVGDGISFSSHQDAWNATVMTASSSRRSQRESFQFLDLMTAAIAFHVVSHHNNLSFQTTRTNSGDIGLAEALLYDSSWVKNPSRGKSYQFSLIESQKPK
jgi:hypothetical protein